MKRLVAFAIIGAHLCAPVFAQEITREELRRTAVPGSETMEVVVTRLTVPVGATIPLHTHAGDEHGVVITESRAETPAGQVIEFPVGATLYFPEGEVHGGLTNVGDAPMVAITTSVVRADAPFATPSN